MINIPEFFANKVKSPLELSMEEQGYEWVTNAEEKDQEKLKEKFAYLGGFRVIKQAFDVKGNPLPKHYAVYRKK